MNINEFPKAFSPQGRENWNIIFCPYGYNMGDDHILGIGCLLCKKNHVDSFLSCERKYETFCAGVNNGNE